MRLTIADELKPCPFCGELDMLDVDLIMNDAVWWDSALRYEHCGYVACRACGVVVKAENIDDAIRIWNTRKGEKE